MSARTFTLNGQLVTAAAGETILEAARNAGVTIPTLCHLDGLSEVAACRLCLVELEGSSKLIAACTSAVQEGMVVHTETPRLHRYRRMIVELLFAERNHVCAVCVSNGHCDLQNQAYAVGMDNVRFEYLAPQLPVDASHQRFGLDHNRCILCTRCVRVCDEVEGAHTWDVMGRGWRSRVIIDLNQPWGDSTTCTSCGKCVQVCPTGSLFDKHASAGEMVKDRDFLVPLTTRREKRHEHR